MASPSTSPTLVPTETIESDAIAHADDYMLIEEPLIEEPVADAVLTDPTSAANLMIEEPVADAALTDPTSAPLSPTSVAPSSPPQPKARQASQSAASQQQRRMQNRLKAGLPYRMLVNHGTAIGKAMARDVLNGTQVQLDIQTSQILAGVLKIVSPALAPPPPRASAKASAPQAATEAKAKAKAPQAATEAKAKAKAEARETRRIERQEARQAAATVKAKAKATAALDAAIAQAKAAGFAFRVVE